MSWSNLSNIGFSHGSYFTYGGYGQFVTRTDPSAEFLRRLQLPNAKSNILATIQVGWRLTPSINVALSLGSSPLPGDFPVIGVYVNAGSDSLPTPPLHPGFVDTYGYTVAGQGPNRFLTLYYITDTTVANTYVALLGLYASLAPKTLRTIDWAPRLRSIPNLSLRVEDTFGGLFQVGGGNLSLANQDGFYDSLIEAAWDTGIVTLEYGLDLPDSEMAETDYIKLGTWRTERAELSDSNLVLTLKELKTRIDTQVPIDLYSRADFPALPNDTVGEPLPFAYGTIYAAKATPVDTAARRFKVAAHRIRAFAGVRIRKDLTDVADITQDVSTFTLHAVGPAYVTNFTDTVVNVTFTATELLKKDSIASVIATTGAWHQEGDYLYVQPPSGQTIDSGTWTIRREQPFQAWVPTNYATKDVSKAEFTLGEDWNRSDEVAVDFEGRVKADGDLMENWADICADFLDYLGEHIFDAKSFSTSRRELLVGLDRYGREVSQLAPSFYIDSFQTAREVLQDICRVAGATLYVDPAGAWRFNVFKPAMSADLLNAGNEPQLTWPHTDLIDVRTQQDESKSVFSRVVVHYAKRHAEGWDESTDQRRLLNQALHGLAEAVTEDREAPLALASDANYLGQRLLTTEGPPIRKYFTICNRPALLLTPGDQLRLTAARPGGFDRIVEILSIDKDFITGRARVELGTRRGFSDSFGWWLIEDVTTPTLPGGALTHLRAEGLPYTQGQLVCCWDNNPIVAPAGAQAIQSVGGLQPIFFENAINGLPALRFQNEPGVGYKHLPLGANVSALTAGEIFLLIKVDTDPATGPSTVYHFGNAASVMSYPDVTGIIQETFGLSVLLPTVNPGPDLTSWRLYNVSVDATAFTQRLDGTQIFTTGAHTFGFTVGTPAIGGGNPSSGSKCYIAEAVMYPRILSASERTAVQNYFATRFALAFGTPGNTPVQWNNAWTDAEVAYARQNYGWWHDSIYKIANLEASASDIRSFEASRWW